MIDLDSAIKFCDSKKVYSYGSDKICVCIKNTGPFILGDYAIRIDDGGDGFIFRGVYSKGRFTGKALDNFETYYDYENIEVLTATKNLFGSKSKKQKLDLPSISKTLLIHDFYTCFIVLPLRLIYLLDSDLLLPFSYLILQVLGKIEEFDKSYVDPTKENEYLEFLYSCAQTIDEIKTNCLNLYLNGVNLEDSMVKESNKRAQLMVESKQLKVITSSFFKNFNADFQPKLTEGDD